MHGSSKTHDTISPQAIIEKWGGVRSGHGWYALPHICPGGSGSVKGSPLKINAFTGTIKCFSTHHELDYFAVREILTGDPDIWIQSDDEAAERRRAAEDRQRREEAKHARYEDRPLPIFTHVDAHLYLKEIATGWGKVEYRRSHDGLIAIHHRPSPSRQKPSYPGKAWTKGLHGSGWEPRIWEPADRIRRYLVVCEGEKDAATGCVRGLATVSYPGGAGRAMGADWWIVQQYADDQGLEIVLCPDTGNAGEKAGKALSEAFRWDVADLEGIPSGDCPLDMENWLDRLDGKKRWDSCWTNPEPGTSGTVFDEDDEWDSPAAFPCEQFGRTQSEHPMYDGETAQIPHRCRECEPCLAWRRRQKGTQYNKKRASDVQSLIRVPGWADIDDLAHYRDLNAHSGRVPGAKRVTFIIPESDRTSTLVLLYDGQMSEKQQRNAKRHAPRHGKAAEVTIGHITQADFEQMIPDQKTVTGEKEYRTTFMPGWGDQEDINDYPLGKGEIRDVPPGQELQRPQIPPHHEWLMKSWRRLRASGNPAWREQLEIVADHFVRGWMMNCGTLSPKVVRSDIKSLYGWDGPIKLIQNVAKYIKGKLPWRHCYGWVLTLADLRQYIPEDQLGDFDEYFTLGRMPHEEWEDLQQDDHEDWQDDEPEPSRRGPVHERPRPSHVCDEECDHGDLFDWSDDWQYERMAA